MPPSCRQMPSATNRLRSSAGMTDRKKPDVAFWVTVAVSVALLYPLSFGPACWIASRDGGEPEALLTAYWPLIWVELNGPAPLSHSIWWSTRLCGGSEWDWGYQPDGRFFWFHNDPSDA